MKLGMYLTPPAREPVHLPGVVIIADDEHPSVVDYTRYLGDETLRESINSLYDRGVLVVYVADEEADLPDDFPVRTDSEKELRSHPIVPELGGMYVLSEEPPDDELALGQGAIWITNDGVHGLSVKAKSKGVNASLEQGQLNYVARKVGQRGNQVQVEHIAPDLENSVASVVVVGKKITVNLGTSGDALPAYVQEGGGDAGIILTARTPGTAGNDLALAIAGLGNEAVGETSAELDGSQIVVTPAQDAGPSEDVAPTLTTDFGYSLVDLVWVNGFQGSAVGNGATFSYVSDLGADANSVIADPDLAYPNVGLKFGPGATAQDVLDYYAEHEDYTIRPTGLASGTDGSGEIAAGTWSFAGGVSAGGPGALTATAASVKAAIEADGPSNALVIVTLTGSGTGLIEDTDETFALAFGVDAGVPTSEAEDIIELIQANADAAALVAVESAGDPTTVVDPVDATYLTGGSDSDILRATIWSD